jgi:hypothetical protein
MRRRKRARTMDKKGNKEQGRRPIMQIGRDARLVLRLTREEKGSVGEKKRNGKRKQQMDIKEYRK